MKLYFLIILFLISSNANARLKPTIRKDIIENRHFYFGAGFGYNFYALNNEFKYKLARSNKGSMKRHALGNFGPVVGIKFQDKYGFGAELGYNFYQSLSILGTKKGKLLIRNTFLDFMNYIPLATEIDDIKVEILAGFGVGHMFMKENGSIGLMGNRNCYRKYGLRGKLGMQYNINKFWAVRGLMVYQRVGPRSGLYAINSAKSVNLDFIYIIQ